MLLLPLRGHLSEAALRAALAALGEISPGAPLVVDCGEMTGYDSDARAYFVSWMSERGGQFSRVAVVTDRPLWRMVVSAMALASKRDMRAFSEREGAEAWALDR